ncbi:unnamed protein product, partial [Brassica rapa subsp. trilocularis]
DAFGRHLCTCGLHFIGQSEILGGGSNLSDKGLNLSGSWQQGHSATYNTPSKGSIGHALTVRIRTENQNQTSFYPFVPHEISFLVELILGHLRYLLTDVPPQPNSPPDNVLRPDRPAEASLGSKRRGFEFSPDQYQGRFCTSKDQSSPVHSRRPLGFGQVLFDQPAASRLEHFGFPLSVPVLSWLFDARGKLPKEPFPVRPPAVTRRSALAQLAAQAARQRRRVRNWDPRAQPSEPILFPKLRIHFADFPCLHCSIDQRLFTLET